MQKISAWLMRFWNKNETKPLSSKLNLIFSNQVHISAMEIRDF